MKYQIAPIWFSSFFEKDNVFLTKRDTRCLSVQLNRSSRFVCSLLCDVSRARLVHKPSRNPCSTSHIDGRLRAMIAIILGRLVHLDGPHTQLQSVYCFDPWPTKSIVCFLCLLQKTITQHTITSGALFSNPWGLLLLHLIELIEVVLQPGLRYVGDSGDPGQG